MARQESFSPLSHNGISPYVRYSERAESCRARQLWSRAFFSFTHFFISFLSFFTKKRARVSVLRACRMREAVLWCSLRRVLRVERRTHFTVHRPESSCAPLSSELSTMSMACTGYTAYPLTTVDRVRHRLSQHSQHTSARLPRLWTCGVGSLQLALPLAYQCVSATSIGHGL